MISAHSHSNTLPVVMNSATTKVIKILSTIRGTGSLLIPYAVPFDTRTSICLIDGLEVVVSFATCLTLEHFLGEGMVLVAVTLQGSL